VWLAGEAFKVSGIGRAGSGEQQSFCGGGDENLSVISGVKSCTRRCNRASAISVSAHRDLPERELVLRAGATLETRAPGFELTSIVPVLLHNSVGPCRVPALYLRDFLVVKKLPAGIASNNR